MSKPSNKALLGCATLLATYSSANLGHIQASELNAAPDSSPDDRATDVNATEHIDVTEIASATVAANAQGIAPASNNAQPEFVAPSVSQSSISQSRDIPDLSVSTALSAELSPAGSLNRPETLVEPVERDAPTPVSVSQPPAVSPVESAQPQLAATAPTAALEGKIEATEATLEQSLDSEADSAIIAQLPIEPPLTPRPQEQQVIEQLLIEAEPASLDASTPYRSSPAITISNPSGFGADNFTGFVGVGYQERTRFGNQDDGGVVVGIGLGDARENIGVQLSYTVASFGGSRDFGTGGFNAKLHKRLADEWSVALGWEGFATTGFVDFEDSIYGSVSHLIRTRENIQQPLSRIALTAGVGSGRFRTEDDVFDDRDTVGVFGSMAVRVAEPVSAIVEWTGQDLAAGLSVVPFKNLPLVLLPAVRDIAGAGDGARFVMGAGVSFEL